MRHLCHLFRLARAWIVKAVRRPSRLIFVPLSRLILTLLRFPRLAPWVVPVWPHLWIESKRGRSFCGLVGYGLLQEDHPVEAWRWISLLFDFGRPSIDEYLLGANCLYQGLGRYRDAMALLNRANECGIKEAARLGLADSSFRVLDSVWARHFGHIALIDYVIKLGILEGRRSEDTILYLPPGSPVANRFLLDQAATHIRIIENPADLPFPESAVQALHYDLMGPRLPDRSTACYWNVAAQTYARWRREGRTHLFELPPELEARARAALQKAGLPREAWFVALHVREREPDRRKSGINTVRNADVGAYFPAIAEITRRGGWVIRIGDPSTTPLPALPNVLDYCHSAIRADWMDIFILSRCRFMIGTNSGPAFVPALYGDIPVVLTNWWPAAERPWQPSDVFIPKMLFNLAEGRYLTLSETLCEPVGWCYSRRHLANHSGVRLEDNDPEIIRAAVREMLARLDGHSQADPEATELRGQADRIYEEHDVVGGGQLAREFLRRHRALIA